MRVLHNWAERLSRCNVDSENNLTDRRRQPGPVRRETQLGIPGTIGAIDPALFAVGQIPEPNGGVSAARNKQFSVRRQRSGEDIGAMPKPDRPKTSDCTRRHGVAIQVCFERLPLAGLRAQYGERQDQLAESEKAWHMVLTNSLLLGLPWRVVLPNADRHCSRRRAREVEIAGNQLQPSVPHQVADGAGCVVA